MKVKKYPQSHLVITKDSKKIIIDPGYVTFEKGFKISDFQGADAYLITHSHADHLGPETIREIVGASPVYGNFDVVTKLKEAGVQNAIEVFSRQNFLVENFVITPIDLPHFQKPNTQMPQNTGFVIDGIFFHPGDGFKISDLSVENLAAPISSPESGELGFNQALELAKSVKAKLIIPIHFDTAPKNPEEFKKIAEPLGIEVRILNHGEETEI